MKKLWDKLLNILPTVWGVLLVVIVTAALLAFSIEVVHWLLNVLGVI